MRILILSRTQGKVQRGAERFVEELACELSKVHQVDILSGKDADSFSKIIRGGYDIVMPFNGRTQSLKASIGRLFGRYKLVIGGHSGIGRDDIWNILICRPDCYVALTDFMKLWAKRWAFGVRVIKIPNGIDLEKFNPNGNKLKIPLKPPIVLSVGALVWYKYHERVIEAVSKLKDVSLLIVGSGPDEEKLKKLGQEKLGKRFKIEKFNFDEMPKLYRSIDLFTLPSWDREAFGLVYLEALSSGIACVGPDDNPRKEIIGDGGILVDVTNEEKYAEVIKKALVKNWGNLPRRQAEKFSWKKIVSQYEKLFEELLDEE